MIRTIIPETTGKALDIFPMIQLMFHVPTHDGQIRDLCPDMPKIFTVSKYAKLPHAITSSQ